MKQETKQRAVGVVVLLALALIFLPMIFDGGGSYPGPAISRIPEPPEVPVLPEPSPTRPVILADSLPDPSAPEADAPVYGTDPPAGTAPDAAAPEAPQSVLDETGLPRGWSVRLATFADSANADALVERLRAAGHRAYARAGEAGREREMTLVFVGPVLERTLAEDYRTQLLKEYELSGVVVRFEPAPF